VSDFSLIRTRPAWTAAAALAVVLGGCATPRSAALPEIAGWDARKIVLAGLDNWEFSGRIAVKTVEEGFNGKLRWAQDEDAFEATASGPLGAGAVRIQGDGRSVTMTDRDGVDIELADAELEFRLRYGYSIPSRSLRFWALGIPDPSLPAETVFDEQGLLARLEQRDWLVTYTRYDEGGGQLMPKVLTAQNEDTRVRLVIDDWIFFDQHSTIAPHKK
jgi:outer membrane lipoprotein LolB